jgi:hypothetical protein
LLARELRLDGARPLITWYDAATGGRVELSVATTANWVAKIAGYLVDEVGVEPGDALSLDPEPHWVTAVVLLSAWSVGAAVDLDGTGQRLDLPLDPMGAGLSALVAAYPDSFVASEASGAELVNAVPEVPRGARLMSALPLDAPGTGWGLLAPIAAGGSVVYAPADAKAADRAAAERVTHTVGVDVPGLPRLGE